jgi:propanediol utilization protein
MLENYDEILERVVNALTTSKQAPASSPVTNRIPVGISNRHVHLSEDVLVKLFGDGYKLRCKKELAQPGQFAAEECVTLCGPRGVIERVRVLGPTRSQTQVEILKGDSFKLGVKGEVRLSGQLTGTSGITLVGPQGSAEIKEGIIVAQRHIHMLPADATRLDVHDGDRVSIEFGGLRGGTLNNVVIRAKDHSKLECHIDTEEANALGVTSGTEISITKTI